MKPFALTLAVIVTGFSAGCGSNQSVISNDSEITADVQAEIDAQDAAVEEEEAAYRNLQADHVKKK